MVNSDCLGVMDSVLFYLDTPRQAAPIILYALRSGDE